MSLRSKLLRLLLWSLGIAAACGVVAMLTGTLHTFSGVMGTAMLTAGASLLLLGAGYLVERPLTRWAGLLGMSAVVVEYVLLLALLWLPFGERLAITIGFIAAPLLPAMICLVMARAATTRVAGWFGLASCAAVFLLLIGGIWFDDYLWDDDTWYMMAGAVATFFPVALFCLVGAGTDRRHWRWVGVAAAAGACGGMFYAMVFNPRGEGLLLAVLVSLAVVIAHANVLMMLPLKRGQLWLRWWTILAAVVTAVFTCWNFVDFAVPGMRHGFEEQLAGACAIIAGCGTLALIVLGRLNRKVVRPTTSLEAVHEVTLHCQPASLLN